MVMSMVTVKLYAAAELKMACICESVSCDSAFGKLFRCCTQAQFLYPRAEEFKNSTMICLALYYH